MLTALACFPIALTAVELSAQGSRQVPVAVATAAEQTVRHSLKLSGTVTAERAAQLSVATSGLVTSLAVDAGDRVTAGDLLLELDDELARYQWQSAQADVKRARQALSDAQRRLDEARRLAPQQSIAETAVRDLESEVVEDDAELQRSLAEAGFRKGVLDRHRLVAPFAGVISSRYSDVGEWVSPGEAVLDLVSTDALRLDFQVSEDYLGRVGARADVEFTLAGDPSQRFPGRILAVVPVTDPTARTFLLRVAADRPVAGMLPGMSVNAELKLDAGRTSVVVPRDSVLRYADGRTVVWVVEPDDGLYLARERLVQTGLSFDGLVEIYSGVSAGERVVIQGNEALRAGQIVTIRSGGS
jgi:RND family efflux transporter MFP subunit